MTKYESRVAAAKETVKATKKVSKTAVKTSKAKKAKSWSRARKPLKTANQLLMSYLVLSLGGSTKVGKALKTSAQAVNSWIVEGRVSKDYAVAASRLFKAPVTLLRFAEHKRLDEDLNPLKELKNMKMLSPVQKSAIAKLKFV